jgi:predicted nicotinamide N-methyase
LVDSSRLARHRRHLLARIHRTYRTVTEEMLIGPLRLNFTRVRDPDEVLDQVVEAEDRREQETGDRRDGNALHLPYWAELWDSAIGMAQMLVKWQTGDVDRLLPKPDRLMTFLDLGCGQGLSGTAAAALGHHVMLADLEAPALLFARLNTLVYEPRVRVRKLNWQTDNLGERFDVILGADVLYERAQWEHLDRFWRAHLAPEGVVLLGEPGRQSGDLFQEWIGPHGWSLERFSEKANTGKTIRLFRLQSL